jgi:ribosomal protein S18 acetylase RimI-like enzyme
MKEFEIRHVRYVIRHAVESDAKNLSKIRVKIDGETENLDREKGEGYIDEIGFKQLIKQDTENEHNLFLVAEVDNNIVGFSRCEGNPLKRMAHKVEFGVCILQEYWGYKIGGNLLKQSIQWADSTGIEKMTLSVLETNEKAIKLYERLGFEVEGILRKDKKLSDGKYYNTILMGRLAVSNKESY